MDALPLYRTFIVELPMTPEMQRCVRKFYLNEALDAEVYTILAARTKSEHNRKILETIAHDERNHKALWASFLDSRPKLSAFRIWFFTLLAKIFGLTFVLNLMESGETEAVEGYKAISEQFPIARKILEDESRHEEELAAMIEEDGLSYISSMVLGLNDALVELTGALAGFTLALNNNKMIGLAGFITGVAATLSMAASEYLSKKTDSGEKHPLKAAVYTGLAYLFTVALLLAPYIIFSAPLVSLAFCLLIAALIILGFTYFVSVVRKSSFLHGFREMLTISFSVALISFLIGWGARAWLQIEI